MASEEKPKAPAKAKKAEKVEDVLVVHSRTEDGAGVNVLRRKGEELSVGELRPLEEGKPIAGEVVSLKAREEAPGVYDVKSELKAPKRPGPSRVATARYRRGWDSLWGSKRRKGRSELN
ncbi:MAG: hypothetical protein AAF411_15375 [Myxococcota bacterium]